MAKAMTQWREEARLSGMAALNPNEWLDADVREGVAAAAASSKCEDCGAPLDAEPQMYGNLDGWTVLLACANCPAGYQVEISPLAQGSAREAYRARLLGEEGVPIDP